MALTTIVQITDTHIMPEGQHWHNSKTDTAGRLNKVCDRLNELNPDAVIMTGDAIDTRSQEAYDHLRSITDKLTMPIYFVPGNHDDRDEMRKAFVDKGYMPAEGPLHYSIDNLPVRLIGLDTNVKDADHGEFDIESVNWLEQTLIADPNKPTLLFMHHFPFKVGQPVFDEILCNADFRFELLLRHMPNVLGVVAGHFHNQLSTTFAGKPFLIGKSVAPSHQFSLDGLKVEGLKLEDPAFTVHTYDDVSGAFISRTEFVVDHDSYVSMKEYRQELEEVVVEADGGWGG